MFYALYTTRSLLNIYSSRSTQVIKQGLTLDGVCMLASSDCNSAEMSSQGYGKLCTLTLKGMVQMYKIKDVQSLESCVLEWSSSLAEPLRLRNSLAQQNTVNPMRVYVEKLLLCDDGTVIVFLTDQSRFEYSNETRLWREISQQIELPEKSLVASQEKYTVQVGGKPIDQIMQGNGDRGKSSDD